MEVEVFCFFQQFVTHHILAYYSPPCVYYTNKTDHCL